MNAEKEAREVLRQYDKAVREAEAAWEIAKTTTMQGDWLAATSHAEELGDSANEFSDDLRTAIAALLTEITPDLNEPDEAYRMCVECGSVTTHMVNEVRFLSTGKTYLMWLCQEHDYDELAK